MPLLDHFRPPLFPLHPWESFHVVWSGTILEYLNRLLPPRYFAAMQVHLGTRVEADIAEFERARTSHPSANGPAANGGVAVATWAPPAVSAVIDVVFPDSFEVQVHDRRDGAELVAVVELVSPGNKDRPEARRAFAAKSAAYLQRGIGLVVADVVTNRQADLHAELLQMLGPAAVPPSAALRAAVYRPMHREGKNQVDIWLAPLAIGAPLPVLPLALRGDGCVPLDLDATYTEACSRSRLASSGPDF